MIRVTEIVFGLEKMWLHRHRDARLIPWHLCLIGLMAGIVIGHENSRSVWIQTYFLILTVSSLVISLFLHHRAIKTAFQPDAACSIKRSVCWILAWILLWGTLGIYMGQPVHHVQMPENTPCQVTGRIEKILPGTPQIRVAITDWICPDQNLNIHTAHPFYAQMKLTPQELEISQGLTKDQWFQTQAVFTRFQPPDVPGMFDPQQWALSENLSGRLKRTQPFLTLYPNAHHNLSQSLELARRHAFEILAKHSPEGIVPALVLGSGRLIDDQTRDTFGRLGIAHVLAVSGLHFGIVALVIVFFFRKTAHLFPWIMRRFGCNRFATAAAIPALLLYLFFVGAPISAQRALIMASCCCFGRLLCRKPNRSRALIFAGILILLFDPMAIYAISFQLSFCAVLGIIWGMDFYEALIRQRILELSLSSRLKKALAMFASTLIMTISTSLTTAPVVMVHFGQLPIFGIFANLLVIPYVSFILMPLAILATLWIIIGLPGTDLITKITSLAETLLTHFANGYEHIIPASCLDIPMHPLPILASILLAVAVLCHFKPSPKRCFLALMSSVLMIAVILITALKPQILTGTDDLRISFIAMGQADATLIEFPDGHTMVVDIGSEIQNDINAGETRMLPYLKRNAIRHIDTLVLTHADYDHVAGIQSLLENCTIGQVWYNGQSYNEIPFWYAEILNHRIPIHRVTQLTPTQNIGNATVQILWPTIEGLNALNDAGQLNENESSVVLRLQYAGFSLLLMGDAGSAVESWLIAQNQIEPVTVLKAGHHGSKSASSQAWIDATGPNFAIYSVGAHNRYHFPHRDVEERFLASHTHTFRTDQQGTIRMTTDGHHLHIETMRD